VTDFPYEDIINMQRPISNHPSMSRENRAAQFSPFAALTGHSDAIAETQRLTAERMELSESETDILSAKVNLLKEKLSEHPLITVTYFKPDNRKDGGEYVAATGKVKKIDEYYGNIVFEGGTAVPFNDIYNIKGDVFALIDKEEF